MDENDSGSNGPQTTREYYVERCDWQEVSPPTAVVRAIARVKECEVDELDTIYEYVDPDSLDTLIRSSGADAVELTFTFDGHGVTVRADGTVFIEEGRRT